MPEGTVRGRKPVTRRRATTTAASRPEAQDPVAIAPTPEPGSHKRHKSFHESQTLQILVSAAPESGRPDTIFNTPIQYERPYEPPYEQPLYTTTPLMRFPVPPPMDRDGSAETRHNRSQSMSTPSSAPVVPPSFASSQSYPGPSFSGDSASSPPSSSFGSIPDFGSQELSAVSEPGAGHVFDPELGPNFIASLLSGFPETPNTQDPTCFDPGLTNVPPMEPLAPLPTSALSSAQQFEFFLTDAQRTDQAASMGLEPGGLDVIEAAPPSHISSARLSGRESQRSHHGVRLEPSEFPGPIPMPPPQVLQESPNMGPSAAGDPALPLPSNPYSNQVQPMTPMYGSHQMSWLPPHQQYGYQAPFVSPTSIPDDPAILYAHRSFSPSPGANYEHPDYFHGGSFGYNAPYSHSQYTPGVMPLPYPIIESSESESGGSSRRSSEQDQVPSPGYEGLQGWTPQDAPQPSTSGYVDFPDPGSSYFPTQSQRVGMSSERGGYVSQGPPMSSQSYFGQTRRRSEVPGAFPSQELFHPMAPLPYTDASSMGYSVSSSGSSHPPSYPPSQRTSLSSQPSAPSRQPSTQGWRPLVPTGHSSRPPPIAAVPIDLRAPARWEDTANQFQISPHSMGPPRFRGFPGPRKVSAPAAYHTGPAFLFPKEGSPPHASSSAVPRHQSAPQLYGSSAGMPPQDYRMGGWPGQGQAMSANVPRPSSSSYQLPPHPSSPPHHTHPGPSSSGSYRLPPTFQPGKPLKTVFPAPNYTGNFDLYAVELPELSSVYHPPGFTVPQPEDVYNRIRRFQLHSRETARCYLPSLDVTNAQPAGRFRAASVYDAVAEVPLEVAITNLNFCPNLNFPKKVRSKFPGIKSRPSGPGILARTGLSADHPSVKSSSGTFKFKRIWVKVGEGGVDQTLDELFEGHFSLKVTWEEKYWRENGIDVIQKFDFAFWGARALRGEDGREIGLLP